MMILALTLAGLAQPAQAPASSAKPRVLLLGDSIRLGYAPVVAKQLADQAEIISPKANGGDSKQLLNQLDELLQQHEPRIIVFNCGLHDLKKSKARGTHQVALAEYEAQLRQIAARLKAQTPHVVFATTTPILDDRHPGRKLDFDRFEADVQRYNHKAITVMKELNVPILDLHAAVVAGDAAQLLGSDGTHFTPAGYDRLAQAVVQELKNLLGKLPKGSKTGS